MYEKPVVVDHGDVFALTAGSQIGGPTDAAFNGIIIITVPQSSAV